MSNNINEKADLSGKEFEARHEILDTEKTGYDKSGAIDAENIEGVRHVEHNRKFSSRCE
jgi:hypothetical protein